jgi:hypothetical protein
MRIRNTVSDYTWLVKVRSARAVEDLQRKELEDQLEAEAYFSGLYKTQVKKKLSTARVYRTAHKKGLISSFWPIE